MIVKKIMTKEVVSVSPAMDIHALAQLFIDNDISGAPVVDGEGKFLGLVLEEGLIFHDKKVHLPTFIQVCVGFVTLGFKKFEDEMKKIAATTVEEIMEKKIVKITEETPVEDVATMIVEDNVHYFPVMKDDKLIGVVTKKDIVRAIAAHKI